MPKICAFFGHREIPYDLAPRLREQIERAIKEFGVDEFWVGGYGDFDKLAANTVLSLKMPYPHIRLRLVCAYPPTQSKPLWVGFDNAFFPDALAGLPSKQHIPKRNLWMAERCDLIIAYVEHASSGIYKPLLHVYGKKPILNLGAYQPKLPLDRSNGYYPSLK